MRRLRDTNVSGALGSEHNDAHARRRSLGILAAAPAHCLEPGRRDDEQRQRLLHDCAPSLSDAPTRSEALATDCQLPQHNA